MRDFKKISAFIIIILFSNCNENLKERKLETSKLINEPIKVYNPLKPLNTELLSYKQVPFFIRHYLDSIFQGGKRFMADPGQNWNGTCIQFEGLPNCQFISGSIYPNECVIAFRGGGLAPSNLFLIIKHSGNKVLSHIMVDKEPKIPFKIFNDY